MEFEFDGRTLRIKMPTVDPGSSGKIKIDVRRDIYSAWKRWCLKGNLNFPKAFDTHGGEILPNGQRMESSFILLNCWRILVSPGKYELQIKGNLQAEDGQSPFEFPVGSEIEIVPEANTEEILVLKPSFMGLGLDLRALLRWWKAK